MISNTSNVNIIAFFFTNSDGTAAVSFTLKFTRITWQSVLTLQLAMENGAFLESPGFLDEVSCENEDDDNCKLAFHFQCLVLLFFCPPAE